MTNSRCTLPAPWDPTEKSKAREARRRNVPITRLREVMGVFRVFREQPPFCVRSAFPAAFAVILPPFNPGPTAQQSRSHFPKCDRPPGLHRGTTLYKVWSSRQGTRPFPAATRVPFAHQDETTPTLVWARRGGPPALKRCRRGSSRGRQRGYIFCYKLGMRPRFHPGGVAGRGRRDRNSRDVALAGIESCARTGSVRGRAVGISDGCMT